MSVLYPLALALSAASTGLGIAGQQKQAAAAEDAQRRNYASNRMLQERANAQTTKSIADSGADVARRDMAESTTERVGDYQQAQKPSVGYGTPIQSALAKEAQRLSTSRAMQTGQGNVASARFLSMADHLLRQQLANQRATQELGVLSDFAQGNNRIYESDITRAQNAGNSYQTAAGIAGLLGSAAGLGASLGIGQGTPITNAANYTMGGVKPMFSTPSTAALLNMPRGF